MARGDTVKFSFPVITRFITTVHMSIKPILLTPSEAREKLEKRREQVDLTRPISELKPPCPGATVHTCQSGDNTGKRYWALKQDEGGWRKSTFLGWIDEPTKTLKQQIDEHGEEIKKLGKAVRTLKEKAKVLSEDEYE